MITEFFVRFWKTEDDMEEIHDVDLIVPISYATTKDELVQATRENLLLAIFYKKIFPTATLALSSWPFAFPGSSDVENSLKEELLRRFGVDYLLAKPLRNSVSEAWSVKKSLPFEPARILIVTGEMHSRSARFIWKKTFPESKVLIRCTSHRYEYQKDHPVNAQRAGWRWILINIERQAFLRLFGLRLASLFRHRAT